MRPVLTVMVLGVALAALVFLRPSTTPPTLLSPAEAAALTRLEAGMGSPASALAVLSRPASDIVTLGPRLDKEPGTQSYGVWLVETGTGSLVLKVYRNPYTLGRLAPALVLQRTLGDLDVSPKVFGVLDPDEIVALDDRLRLVPGEPPLSVQHPRPATFGVLMELVPDAWNLPRSTRNPLHVAEWDGPAMIGRMNHIRGLCDRLRIKVNDLQFLVPPSGRLLLFDLDRSWWLTSQGRWVGLDAPTQFLASTAAPVNDFSSCERSLRAWLARVPPPSAGAGDSGGQ